jgi:hypothetical protein
MSALDRLRDSLPAWWLGAFAVLFFTFMLAPILVVVWVAFSAQSYIGFPIPSYSLRWFQRVMSTSRFCAVSSSASRLVWCPRSWPCCSVFRRRLPWPAAGLGSPTRWRRL